MTFRRRKWQPTLGFLPGESHRQRSLVGCSPWGRTELDMTEVTWRGPLKLFARRISEICIITEQQIFFFNLNLF